MNLRRREQSPTGSNKRQRQRGGNEKVIAIVSVTLGGGDRAHLF